MTDYGMRMTDERVSKNLKIPVVEGCYLTTETTEGTEISMFFSRIILWGFIACPELVSGILAL